MIRKYGPGAKAYERMQQQLKVPLTLGLNGRKLWQGPHVKNDDDFRKAMLDAVESTTDAISQLHPEPCKVGERARIVRDVMREEKERMSYRRGPCQAASPSYRTAPIGKQSSE
jgi:hypothetical protein